jgi:hypothetical protein
LPKVKITKITLENNKMNKTQLLKRLETAWKALEASFAGLSETEMMQPGVSGAWSVKDILAHVTSWEEEALKYLPLILAGEKTPRYASMYGGIDAFNAQVTEQRRSMSLAEVLHQRIAIHCKLIDFIGGVPEEQLAYETRFRHNLRLDTYRHYLQHAEAIRKWRDQRSDG